MFIDLLDSLRCPADHADSWLVAAIERMAGRYVERGTLGCPVCRASYEVRDFVAMFSPPLDAGPTLALAAPGPDEVMRLAAMLDLRTPGGFIGLDRGWAHYAAPLAVSFDVQCVVFDDQQSASPGDGVSLLIAGTTLPLASGSLRGIALDSDARLGEALRVVRPGGRLIGPTAIAVPERVAVLARDERSWVAERPADLTPIVPLTRSR